MASFLKDHLSAPSGQSAKAVFSGCLVPEKNQKVPEVFRKRGGKLHVFSGSRMHKSQILCVQGLLAQKRLVLFLEGRFPPAVKSISQNRVSYMGTAIYGLVACIMIIFLVK